MRFHVLFARLMISTALAAATSSAIADGCNTVLEQGVRNTYQRLARSDVRGALTNALCTSQLQTMKNSAGGGLSLGVIAEGIPIELGANYDEASANSLKNSSCANGSSNMSNDNYERVLQAVVDPAIVQAWSSCKEKERAGGLLLDGKLNGSVLILSLRFRNVGNVSETTLKGKPQISGATCDGMDWGPGTKIDGSQSLTQCRRFGEEPVTITINSTFDGAMFYIPAPPKLEVVKTTADPSPRRTSGSQLPPPPPLPPKSFACAAQNMSWICPTPGMQSLGSACTCNVHGMGLQSGAIIEFPILTQLPTPGGSPGGVSRLP